MKQNVLLFLVILVWCIPKHETNHTIYIPLAINSELPPSNMGVETEQTMCDNGRWYNPNTPLKISVRWSEVETERGVYDWSMVDHELCGYTANWITVKTAPLWAVANGERVCNLPTVDNLDAAYTFTQAVIDRYRPEYIEVWNEPDSIGVPDAHAPLYGCIGDGEKYGEFVAGIYQNVTGAKIIMGAISNQYGEFVGDMLIAANGNYDGVSFHCHLHFYDYLHGDCKSIYDDYSEMVDVPVYISETAVRYKTGSVENYRIAQVQHYRQLQEIPTVKFWYTVGHNGWPNIIVGDIRVSTDMMGYNVVTDEFIDTPVHKLYMGSSIFE